MSDLPAPRLGDRSLFPDLSPRSYCNHAAISPASELVRRAARAVVDDYATHGMAAFPRWRDQRERLRERLATLLGAQAPDLALVPNTTTGVVDIAQCLPWRAGDRILCFEGEFPTNVTPWQQAARTFDLQVDLLPLDGFGDGSGDGEARVEEALRRGDVRLVAASAVQFQTGLRMPLATLADLAHRHGAELFVDAIQATGVVPLDVAELGIDYLASGSHKWLMGLEGGAVLYVHPERIGDLEPRIAGWLSHEGALAFLVQGEGHLRYDRPIRERADFLELGAPNTVGFAALEASVGLLLELGVPAIYDHVQAFHDALEPALVERGFTSLRAADPAARSGILSLRPPAGVDDGLLAEGMSERGIAVTHPDGNLRIAPHWPNDPGREIPAILAAVDEVLGS